ncbi:MAG: hypothetical protein CM15mP128_5540 [Methanobacteriota archaeon]|nr:MAG: hypothetical protein CM15mP128_5540 [Euryarchaeota archaeon]
MTEHAERPSRGVDAVRHARHLRMEEIGADGQARLGAAAVAVVGAGDLAALCCFTSPQLALVA